MILDQAATVGLRDLPDVPSLALGVGVVSPLELTAAYAVFPNGGFRVVPRAVVRVVDDSGAVLDAPDVDRTRVLSPASAFQMVMMLQDVLDRGTATTARARGVRFPAGGKTGTTDDFKDAWLSGSLRRSWPECGSVSINRRRPRPRRLWCAIRLAYSERVHARGRPGVDRRGSFAVPEGVRERASSGVAPARDRGLPGVFGVFQDSDADPAGLCPIHGGPQNAGRSRGAVFASLGRRVPRCSNGDRPAVVRLLRPSVESEKCPRLMLPCSAGFWGITCPRIARVSGSTPVSSGGTTRESREIPGSPVSLSPRAAKASLESEPRPVAENHLRQIDAAARRGHRVGCCRRPTRSFINV